jgi:flagellar hook-length control protein FliK
MLTNLRGRVEADPMRVPTAAAMTVGTDTSFDAVLQQLADDRQAADDDAPAAEPVAAEEPTASAASEDAATAPARDEADDHHADADANDDLGAESDALATSRSHLDADDTDQITRRGEPERQETAGKGPDSPRPSSRDAESLRIAVITPRLDPAAAPGANATAATASVGAVGATKATGTGLLRGFDPGTARPTAAAAAPATAAGYRTNDAASAELVEQARDSVFKQILMKLTPGGGEMRLRLDPPDLGELDLRLVVDAGNQLTLTIGAERGDVAQLLQRHLDELKHALHGAGLEVTDAEVHTRGDGSAADRSSREHGRGAAAADTDDDPQPTRPVRHGYVHATGHDFWA